MHSKRERRLQALESGLSERVQSLSEQAQELILAQLTDSEIEALCSCPEIGEPQTEAEVAAVKRWAELQNELPEVQSLKIPYTVGYWALEMQKAARI